MATRRLFSPFRQSSVDGAEVGGVPPDFQSPAPFPGPAPAPSTPYAPPPPPPSPVGRAAPELPPEEARSGETPRERAQLPGGAGGASGAPPRPMSPTPMAGSVSQGVVPFQPLPGPTGGPTAIGGSGVARRRLLGGARGLTGGGLGIAGNPINLQESDPISALIRSLLMSAGRGVQ